MNKKPVYCMHCEGWYTLTKTDQCDIPVPREVRVLPKNIVGFEIEKVNLKSYGTPSQLNKDNNCSYYKEISFLAKINRRIMYGIPLKPLLENLVEK